MSRIGGDRSKKVLAAKGNFGSRRRNQRRRGQQIYGYHSGLQRTVKMKAVAHWSADWAFDVSKQGLILTLALASDVAGIGKIPLIDEGSSVTADI
ncbi:hypothetical protein PoB_001062100 [Plakobranchus ocellatus]|uniref:Uncharacterized protein n=1 Tax=Plakobranchus ocellatus TaxID=259542 RepID=A0AAV3YNZ0_9GAST|nr:hypothetical protein PoB_001062100 [Plakobranchus ocellatus]